MASFGVAALATVLTAMLGGLVSPTSPDVAESDVAQQAYNVVFLVIAFSAVFATGQALFLPGKERNRQLQSNRTAEYAPADAL